MADSPQSVSPPSSSSSSGSGDGALDPPLRPDIEAGPGTDFPDPPSGAERSPYANMDPAPVPGGAAHPGKGVAAVSIEALKTFNTNIARLAAPLERARTELTALPPVRSGSFGSARNLEVAVSGGAKKTGVSLVEATSETVHDLVQAIEGLRQSMTSVAEKYGEALRKNNLTTADLDKAMGSSAAYVNGFKAIPDPTQSAPAAT